MPYSCSAQAERLPIINEPCLIINQGTADIIVGNDVGSLKPYGTHIPPGRNFIYDLSKQRYIASASGTQPYDLLPGGASSIPDSTEIAADIVASNLASDIASQITTSGLASAIATQVLTTGIRTIDVPAVLSSGTVSVNPVGLNVGNFDVSAYQSVEIAVRYDGGAFPAGGDFLQFQLLWKDAANTLLLRVDTFEITSTAEPSGSFTGKSSFITTPVRGARLQVVSNTGTAASTLTYSVWGSNRMVPRFTIWQDTTNFLGTDGIIGQQAVGVEAITPGNSTTRLFCSPASGPVTVIFVVTTTGANAGIVLTSQYGSVAGAGLPQINITSTLGAGTYRTFTTDIYVPRRPIVCQLLNSGPGNITSHMITVTRDEP